MKRTILRFGVALSLVAAASVFVHAGADHAVEAAAGHACSVCRVATDAADVPSIEIVPIWVAAEGVPAAAVPTFSSELLSLPFSRGPPAR